MTPRGRADPDGVRRGAWRRWPGIAALLLTRRYLEAHHHKAVALAD